MDFATHSVRRQAGIRRNLRTAKQLIGCVCVTYVSGLLTAAQAQPRVTIQSATRFELHASHSVDEVRVRGALLDDLGNGLSHQPVKLHVTSQSGTPLRRFPRRTDEHGRFRAVFRLPIGQYRLTARFPGSAYHTATKKALPLDLERVPVALHFEHPSKRRLNLDRPKHTVAVTASSALSGAGLAITLRDEHEHELARGRTDERGRFEVRLSAEELGSAGRGKLVAHTDSDDRRAAAQTELALIRFRPTTLKLERTRDGDQDTDRVVLEGTLRHSQGGLPHKAIGLFAGDRHLATVLTEGQGRFRYRASAEALLPDERAQRIRVVARFDADAPWITSSASDPVEIVLEPPPPPSPLWLIVPSLLCLLWLGLARWRGGLPKTHEARASKTLDAGIHGGAGHRLGVSLQHHIRGSVADSESGAPLGDARILLWGPAGPTEGVAVAADGGFHSHALPPGRWRIRVEAPGYARSEGEVTIPHRGAWSAMEVRLESLRAAAYRAYQPAAVQVLGSAHELPGTTPREMLERARAQSAISTTLRRLVSRVERAVYDRPGPADRDVSAIARDAAEAVAEIRNDPKRPNGESPTTVVPDRKH